MTMQLRQAINNYKPIQRKVLAAKQIQGGSRGLASKGSGRPTKVVKYPGTKTRTVARPAQGQN